MLGLEGGSTGDDRSRGDGSRRRREMPETGAPETGVVLVPVLVGVATGVGVAEPRPETAKGLVGASWP